VNQPHRSDPDFIVLHTLRCIGVSSEERIAGASGMEIAETLARLRHLYDRGLVELDPGPFGGWSLTVNGLTTGQEMVREEVVMAGGHQQVLGGYQAFLRLNPALLQICSDWQMQRVGNSPILNNHTDPDYDAKVLSRLIRIDDAAQQVCSDLASHLMRFGLYRNRLSTAIERALAGDSAYVTDSFDSYHTVWFQLHEDLLVTLGISREDERGDSSEAS
jgi:hypothetical protein